MVAEVAVLLCCAVLLLASSGLCDRDTVIAVVSANTSVDNNSSSCVSGADSQCTLSELSQHLTSSYTEVRLCAEQLLLETVISIHEVDNITIVGYGSPVKLTCPHSTQAGLNFTAIINLTLSNFKIVNCGFHFNTGSTVEETLAAVSIHQCMNVNLTNVSISDGPGVGLALLDVYGEIRVTESNFTRNGHERGGSGLYIIWSGTHSLTLTTKVKIHDCQFLNNTASTKEKHSSGQDREKLHTNGGGVYVNASRSSNMQLTITDSTFMGNNASNYYGGGIFASFSHLSNHSFIEVHGSNFSSNHAKFGGGLHAEYTHGSLRQFQSSISSSFLFVSNNYERNSAVFGGGISLFSIKSTERYTNPGVVLENCTLTENRAQYGSAVAILPDARSAYTQGYLPEPVIKDCRVISNKVIKSPPPYARDSPNQYMRGAGALYCFRHTLTLEGDNTFAHNKGSAMYLGFSSVTLVRNSVTNFTNNTAYYGGGMHLLVSVIYLDRDTRVYFAINRANGKGGAIYEESPEIHMVDYSQTCFIDLYSAGDISSQNNISVAFTRNLAGNNLTSTDGHSIFTTSILPCCREFQNCENMTKYVFNARIGNFSYSPSDRSYEIVTDINHAKFEDCNTTSKPLGFIPGKRQKLPHVNYDDFNQLISTSFLVTIKHTHGMKIKTSPEFSEISGNNLKLFGNYSSTNVTKVTLSSGSFRKIALAFDVELKPCPPGYILHFDKVTHLMSCICSVDTHDWYKGIEKCNFTIMQAYRNPNYWIGYDKNKNESENTLWTGHCPKDFCSLQRGTLLPETANRTALCGLTCSDYREGKLCGRCKENSSVHYHSLTLHCKPSKYCHLGWLFYLLSEILPVTVIFLVILHFNISFTSGVVNSFVFFSQVLMTPRFTAKGFPDDAQRYGRLVYLFFNLDVFVLDELSYCLWNSATALDILSFSYITMTYSLLLVVLVVFIRNKCSIRHCCRGASRSKSPGSSLFALQGNIIHGLSSFLVLFSSHCVKISIMILTPSFIFNKGARKSHRVVHFNGEVSWMSTHHLPYAVPAIVILVAILIPSVLLLVYPLHYRILSILRLSERKFIRKIFGPLERLKPFFDSFQGSFKDNMRFFSGLYFMYRYLFLMVVVWMVITDAYFILSVLLGFILAVHSVLQPYRERLHNIIDMLLLGNLTLINLMSAYDVSKASTTGSISSNNAILTLWAQVLLTHLPLLCVLLYFGRKACLAVHKRVFGVKKPHPQSSEDIDESSTSVFERMDYGTF